MVRVPGSARDSRRARGGASPAPAHSGHPDAGEVQETNGTHGLVLRIPGRGFYLEQLGGMTFGVPAEHQNQLVSANRWRAATMLAERVLGGADVL